MKYTLLCFAVLGGTYTLNMLYTSVFYHRGFAHRAVRLRQWARKLIVFSGNWVTGIDPKTWVCMHRLHHKYSDTRQDPHSPRYEGILPIVVVQLRSYGKTLQGLVQGHARYTSIVKDLHFPVNRLNLSGLWFLPHVIHTGIGVAIGAIFNAWALGGCYLFGMMSHPLQGWAVNSLGHKYGYRNFRTRDRSQNNLLVCWLVMGEGLQNNHHHAPRSAKFSFRWWELDMGYWLCCFMRFLGVLDFDKKLLLRPPSK